MLSITEVPWYAYANGSPERDGTQHPAACEGRPSTYDRGRLAGHTPPDSRACMSQSTAGGARRLPQSGCSRAGLPLGAASQRIPGVLTAAGARLGRRSGAAPGRGAAAAAPRALAAAGAHWAAAAAAAHGAARPAQVWRQSAPGLALLCRNFRMPSQLQTRNSWQNMGSQRAFA